MVAAGPPLSLAASCQRSAALRDRCRRKASPSRFFQVDRRRSQTLGCRHSFGRMSAAEKQRPSDALSFFEVSISFFHFFYLGKYGNDDTTADDDTQHDNNNDNDNDSRVLEN